MTQKSITLSVIIVTWNSAADIDICLTSLKKALKNISHEVFVIDNVSTDQTVKIISSRYHWVTLLPQRKNHGFGQGNNIGLSRAKGTYILLLNPDTKVNAHAMKAMVSFLNTHPKAGTVGPEQINEAGAMIHMISRNTLLGTTEHLIEKIYSLCTRRSVVLFPYAHRVPILNAGCLMARSTLLPTRKWFDPQLFLYGEEKHLFEQVRACRWESYFLRDCCIYHYREKSIGQTGKKFHYSLISFSLLYTRAFQRWITSIRQFFK